MAVTRNKPVVAPVTERPAHIEVPVTRNLVNRCSKYKHSTGERCKRPSLTGLNVCARHGGQLPEAQAKHRRAKVATGLRALVTPIEADHPQANPIVAFEMEFRRTVGRILYYDEAIAGLTSEKDLVWGKASEEKKDGIDADEMVSYTLTKFEARANMYHILQMDERKHLTDLTKLWISAKLDEKRLQIAEQTVFMLNGAVTDIVRGLGHDANDPDVRNVVRMALLRIPGVERPAIEA